MFRKRGQSPILYLSCKCVLDHAYSQKRTHRANTQEDAQTTAHFKSASAEVWLKLQVLKVRVLLGMH